MIEKLRISRVSESPKGELFLKATKYLSANLIFYNENGHPQILGKISSSECFDAISEFHDVSTSICKLINNILLSSKYKELTLAAIDFEFYYDMKQISNY